MSSLHRLAWGANARAHGYPGIWRSIDAFAAMSADEARLRMGELLLRRIRYFGTRADALPEWRDAARARDADELWALWPSLPILGKDDLRTRFDPARLIDELGLSGVRSSTGGSTGEPTPFLHDPAMRHAKSAATMYCRLRFGWRPGMPTVAVWGSERDIGRQRSWDRRLISRARNERIIDGYRLTGATVDALLGYVAAHGSVAVSGFTSMLEYVARETLASGRAPAPGKVVAAWNGGEMLFPHQSETFSRAFGTPIRNYYAGRELSAMAYQGTSGAALRVLRPLLMVEVVDDAGRPAAAGEVGRLVWTSTVCGGTPFLRYDIGDLGWAGEGDGDDSGIRALGGLEGRRAGLVELPNGRVIHTLFWNHLFKDYAEVFQFQVAFVGGARLELRLLGGGMSTERVAELTATVGAFAGDIPIAVRWLDRLPRTDQGKLLQVVREG